MKRPKFISKLKLKKELCDVEGVLIEALSVGEVYEVEHQETEVTDEDGNSVMAVVAISINGFEASLLPESFDDFFEEVSDGEGV